MKFIIKLYCDSEEELSNKNIKDMVDENMLQHIDCAPFQVEKVEVSGEHSITSEYEIPEVADPDLSYGAMVRDAKACKCR